MGKDWRLTTCRVQMTRNRKKTKRKENTEREYLSMSPRGNPERGTGKNAREGGSFELEGD